MILIALVSKKSISHLYQFFVLLCLKLPE